jgi:hypothetical protein
MKGGEGDRVGKDSAMATARTLGDSGSRATPAMGALQYVLARANAGRETPPRQTARAFMLGLDDATLATFDYDRMAVDQAGRNGFPL